jgi:cyclophilin family peptidyl-prolyl cis-trans isomerase
MKLQLRQFVRTCAQQPRLWRRMGIILCACICTTIVSDGIMAPAAEIGTIVRFDLNYSVEGDSGPIDYIDIGLFDTEAPITVANFLKYINNGLYNNTIVHRSIDGFVIQGGGFAPELDGQAVTALNPIMNYGPIQNEFSPNRSNVSGTIAMAKLGGDPNSATNQWFVNVGNNSSNLDYQNGGFTVFGKILGDGMALISAINSLPTYDLSQEFGGDFTDVPMFDEGAFFVTITRAAVVSTPAPPPSTSGSAKLSGVLYFDKNHNGVMDGEDYILAGAKVSLMRTGSSTPVATVYAAADGSYQFSSLAAGTYSISMDSAGTAAGTVSLADAQTTAGFDVAPAAYPVSLLSSRMLLASSPELPRAAQVLALQTSLADGIAALGTDGNALAAGGDALAQPAGVTLAPEPSSLVTLSIGALVLGGIAWRRKK